MNKKISKNKDNRKEEPTYKAGEVMSMLEQLNDGIQLLAEQHTEVVSRLDSLENKTDRLQEDVTEIKYKLSEKVDREEFEKLEKRMIKIEKLVFSKLS